jgi:hypothetical protein
MSRAAKHLAAGLGVDDIQEVRWAESANLLTAGSQSRRMTGDLRPASPTALCTIYLAERAKALIVVAFL